MYNRFGLEQNHNSITMKKVIFIIALLTFLACTADNEPIENNNEPPIEPDTMPTWLIGSFQSHWFPQSTNLTVITETSFSINLNDFSNISIQYPYTYNVQYSTATITGDDRHLTLHLENDINITFRKVDDPSSNSITIEINERKFGLFKKV